MRNELLLFLTAILILILSTMRLSYQPTNQPKRFDLPTAWSTNEADRKQCAKWITESPGKMSAFNSQYRQDFILYNALFKDKNSGVYLDLAAADPKSISNTWFFDHCLHWEGICIDGDNKQWGPLKTHRNCQVVENCVDSVESELEFVGHGVLAGVDGHNKLGNKGERRKLKCYPLSMIFKEYGVTHVDYISLDIEGHELEALKGIDFNKVTIDVFTIEGNVAGPVEFLEGKGYERAGHLYEDVLMVRKETEYNAKFKKWFASITEEQKKNDFKCIHDKYCICGCHRRYEKP